MITSDAIQIPQTWTDLDTLIDREAEKSVLLQNIGYSGDNISIALSIRQPAQSFNGILLNQINPMIRIKSPKLKIWVKYFRFDDLDKYPQRQGLLQVQDPDDQHIAAFFSTSGNGSATGITSSTITQDLVSISSTLEEIRHEIRLLNVRFEEVNETGIYNEDISI